MTIIDEYLEEKELQVKKEKLTAWKEFYLSCNNEYLATKVERQLDKL